MRHSIHVNIKKIISACLSLLYLSAMPVYAGQHDIKMVVTAAFVSESGMPVYEEISRYLSKTMARSVQVVSGTTYHESDLLLEQGIVQVGFICGLPYTRNAVNGKYSLVAMPVMAMKKGQFPDANGYEDIPGKYYSYTIVHKDSSIKSWADLKGKSYTYNDQNSNSGYNMPRYKLLKIGAKSWEDYFSKVIVSGSHEESIRLVAEGIVDSSSVDSLVLDYDRVNGNKYAKNVKIIEHLFPGGSGIPPVVLSSRANPLIHSDLQRALVNMHKDPEGKRILDKALISHFTIANDVNYNDIRIMEKAAEQAGFKDHVEK